MTEAECPKCDGEMVPRKRERDQEWFFVCKKYPQCRGIRKIYFDKPDSNYDVANSGRMIAAAIDRLVEQLKEPEERESAKRDSVSHVRRIDKCVTDYWRNKR